MKTLSEEQEAAVASEAAITCVLAGPGSGKTEVLTSRICRRIAAGVDPLRMVAFSFTNAAAHEITKRLSLRAAPRLGFVGTRHGWCFRLLQKYGDKLGYKAGAISLVTAEQSQEMLFAEAARLFPGKGANKTNLRVKDIQAAPGMRSPEVQLVYAQHARSLKIHNAVDYDGVLAEAHALLCCHAGKMALEIDELFADEKQDDSRLDWDIDGLIPAVTKFYIGDPDQSIYSFRGAAPHLFDSVPGAAYFTLEDNYRCASAVTDAANALISRNVRIVSRYTRPMTEGGSVYRLHNTTDREELRDIVNLLTLHRGQGIPVEKMAVLARNNDLAEKVREEVRRAGLPLAEAERAELPGDWPLAIATVALMHNPNNDLVAERWLRASGAPAADVTRQRSEAAIAGVGLLENWKGYDARPFKEPVPIDDVATQLVLSKISRESVRLINERMAVLPQTNPTTGDLLHDLWNHQAWSKADAPDGITVSTIHGAKGKEWTLVMIAALEEGILPGRGSEEEERRLAYVGFTRAEEILYLSTVATRWKYGKPETAEDSRFIQEAGL